MLVTINANQSYRPARASIARGGLLLVIAHFFSGIGAGAWLFSVALDFPPGLAIAWLGVGVASGTAHLLFAGGAKRLWRVMRLRQGAWMSRALLGCGLFLAGGAGYLSLPSSAELARSAFLALSLLGVAVLLLYEGSVVRTNGIRAGGSRLLPVLYVAYGLRGGAAVVMITAFVGGPVFELVTTEVIRLWVVVSMIVLILLWITARHTDAASPHSMSDLVAGRVSPAARGGSIALGILIAVLLCTVRVPGSTSLAVIGVIGTASLICDFYFKYEIVKPNISRGVWGRPIGRI